MRFFELFTSIFGYNFVHRPDGLSDVLFIAAIQCDEWDLIPCQVLSKHFEVLVSNVQVLPQAVIHPLPPRLDQDVELIVLGVGRDPFAEEIL